jgi:hypothetical protein
MDAGGMEGGSLDVEDDYLMLDADHILRIKPSRDGDGWEGDVVLLPSRTKGSSAATRGNRKSNGKSGRDRKEGMTATHLFDLPAEPDLDQLRERAVQAIKAYQEG